MAETPKMRMEVKRPTRVIPFSLEHLPDFTIYPPHRNSVKNVILTKIVKEPTQLKSGNSDHLFCMIKRMVRIWKSFFWASVAFSLCPSASADLIDQLQRQSIKSQQNSSSNGVSLIALDYFQEKVRSGRWVFSAPESADPTTEKPRMYLTTPAAGSTTVFVPRWEIMKKKAANGNCSALPKPEQSLSASLSASDCPEDAIAYQVDESLVGSVQLSPGTGEEQQGFLAVPDYTALTVSERNSIFSNPAFSFPPGKLKIVPLSILSYVIGTGGTEIEAVRVNLGGLLVEIPIQIMKSLKYVESGTGRIVGIDLQPLTGRNVASLTCPALSPIEVGCTGLGSATCSTPNFDAAKVQKLFCKPASGTLGNFIVSNIPSELSQLYLSNFGTLYDVSGTVVMKDEKIISMVAQNGFWYALRSDGALLKGTDVRDIGSFSPVPCLKLERAEGLVPDAPVLSGLSCM